MADNISQSSDTFDPAKWLAEAVVLMKLIGDVAQQNRGLAVLTSFITFALNPHHVVGDDVETNIKVWIRTIDQRMTAQMNEILHNPVLQKLESTWRGLHYLVVNTETKPDHLEIRVLNVTKEEIAKDFENAGEYDMSELFKKVYEEEYGIICGRPYGLLIGDFEFNCRSPEDVQLLDGIANIAATSQAVFLAAVSPRSLGLTRWSDLVNPRDLSRVLTGEEHKPWHVFRESYQSSHVALLCLRVLARQIYGDAFHQVKEFEFKEDVVGPNQDKFLWMNPAWCYAVNIATAFATYGWMARIRGVEGGGKVEGLPTFSVAADDGYVTQKGPTEIMINDRREVELEKLGFISLMQAKGRDYAVFFSATSTQQRKSNDTPPEVDSTRIDALLCACRFSQFIKVMVSSRCGSFLSPTEMEKWLNHWIMSYTLAGPADSTEALLAQGPLSWAEIKVREIPGHPGTYRAVLHIRPYYQFQHTAMDLSLRIVLKQVTG